MPLQATSGAASQDAFGGNGVAVVPTYIEDVMSTWLYTGNSSTQTITNGIDLSTKGGLVWVKDRTSANNHVLTDTVRGASSQLASNSGNAATAEADRLTSFNTNGFSLSSSIDVNGSSDNYVSWSLAKTPKFFDIVTYTGDGNAGRTISHNLGSVPACMIVKKTTSSASNWAVYHRSLGATKVIWLQLTDAAVTRNFSWNSTEPTSTVFTVGSGGEVNTSGQTYVAYLFAHEAGGFGTAGTDNVISCGSFTTDGSGNATVSLGYEPQWLMVKASTYAQSWYIEDNMRAFNLTSRAILFPNLPNAEATGATAYLAPNSTGFAAVNGQLNASTTYIYIAIRRGPMKVPTTGTSVFSPNSQTASTGTAITTNFPPDLQLYRSTAQVANEGVVVDRLRGVNTTTTANSTPWLDTTTTAAEASASSVTRSWGNTGFQMPGFVATIPSVFYSYRRAPSFMDIVCYSGTGATLNPSHNLGVIPELKIIKCRSSAVFWIAGGSIVTGGTQNNYIVPNTNAATVISATYWTSGADTSTTFSTRTGNGASNDTGQTYVAYLFATCAGVSKVGSYTGTGTTQTISCGFTAGARFVLIKRTDSTGDWYVWDSARGIVSGNDSYLLLNSTAAEVTSTDYIDTYSAGFEISSTAPAAINANGGSFIFFAVA